jgi:hypothetical protein
VTEVFHEVDTQLRAARFQMMARRGWPYAVGLAVVAAIVGLAAWGLSAHQQSVAAQASDGYAAAADLLQKGDLKGADAKFAVVAKSDAKAYRTLALMQQAGIAAGRNDQKAQIALLDQAAQAAPNPILGDAAKLEAAYVAMDTASYDAVHARLLPLAELGRPYRLLAKEALAMSELAAGKLVQARNDLQVISLSVDASEIQRNRASAAIALIQSGSWASLTPIANASAGLTPQAPPPRVGPSQSQAGQTPADQGPPDQDQQPAPQAGAAQ